MSKRYQVLARRYRPKVFQDVLGQEPAVITLKNAIRFQRLAHAYLFCGSRGVGKTTLARLFAKALNCQDLTPDFEPCGNCPSCLEIASGQSLDVIEIDGASNRGIDDIRQINETAMYAPSHGGYKIYIIDEVHMLTKEAFNALLKTLEEPPEKAKFFFATTEAHKVLPTIISRCQRFDLARISPSTIALKLKEIANDLSRPVESEALELIASFSDGSLRDAESLFDQILCFSDSGITAAIVRQTLGLAPKELFSLLDSAFAACHLPFAFELVETLFQTGKDLAHFFEELIEHYRNIVHAKCKNLPDGKIYSLPQALYILDLLIQAESAFQRSAFQRIALESILLQIIRSKNRIPIEVLVRHLTENADKLPKELPPELPKTFAAEMLKDLPKELPKTFAAEMLKDLPKELPKEILPEKPPSAEVIKALEPVVEPQATPPVLKAVPFNPYVVNNDDLKEDPKPLAVAQKPQSHYDTIIRFAAVEFEGIIKN